MRSRLHPRGQQFARNIVHDFQNILQLAIYTGNGPVPSLIGFRLRGPLGCRPSVVGFRRQICRSFGVHFHEPEFWSAQRLREQFLRHHRFLLRHQHHLALRQRLRVDEPRAKFPWQ